MNERFFAGSCDFLITVFVPPPVIFAADAVRGPSPPREKEFIRSRRS